MNLQVDVTTGPSGPHGLLFLDATLEPQLGFIPIHRSAVAYYDKIFNVIGVQPTALVYTTTINQGLTQWEGGLHYTRKSRSILSFFFNL
jgi:hypothetical protein